MSLKVNPIGVNTINFKGENNTKTSDNTTSLNEMVKQNTKLMVGASALAAAVIAGIAIIRGKKPQKSEVVNNVVDNVVKEVKKSVHDMSKEELAQWSEINIEKIQKVFSKKRDLTNWKKHWNKEKPYDSYRFRSNDCVDFKPDNNGIFFVEEIYTKSGKHLRKAYNKDGTLDCIFYNSNDSWVNINRGQDGKFWLRYCDRNAMNHKSPSVHLDFEITDEGLKYKTDLYHKVPSKEYYSEQYQSVRGPKPKKEKEIDVPQE